MQKQKGKSLQESRTNAIKSLHDAEDKIETVTTLKQLLNDSKVITGNTLKDKATRLFAEFTGNDQLTDTQLYDAIKSRLYKVGLENAHFGNVNEREFGFLVEPLPDSKKTRAAALALLDNFEKVANKNIRRSREILISTPTFTGQQLQNQMMGASASIQEAVPQSFNNGQSQTIAATAPDGTPIQIPNDQRLIDQLLADGGQIIMSRINWNQYAVNQEASKVDWSQYAVESAPSADTITPQTQPSNEPGGFFNDYIARPVSQFAKGMVQGGVDTGNAVIQNKNGH